MQSDDTFIERLKARCPEAYVVLVERFEDSLYRFFYCDHRDHHIAQEQTAETFASLVTSLPGMKGGAAQLRAFVFATARHVQLRRWRSAKRRFSTLADAVNVHDTRPSAETTVSIREELEIVLTAIGQVSDPARSILILRFVEAFSVHEIAEAVGLPVGTVKSHIHRSRLRLKQILSKTEGET